MRKIFFFFIFFIPLIINPVFASQEVFIILSRGIIPYYKTVMELKKKMSGFQFKEYNLEKERDQGKVILNNLEKEPPDLILSVGPEATYLIKDLDTPSPKVFTMILNPEKVFLNTTPFPGVSMNYPPSEILLSLNKAFPTRKEVGIFYSPDLNQALIERYDKEGEKIGLRICPFPVSSAAEIRSVLKSPTFNPDIVLFIPDRVIIKEKLIKYIIEECLFRKIPSVGFNTWFAKSGALMAFYLDYKEMGIQTGELALRVLKNKKVDPIIEPPKNLKIILNLKVAQKFKFKISEEVKEKADRVIK